MPNYGKTLASSTVIAAIEFESTPGNTPEETTANYERFWGNVWQTVEHHTGRLDNNQRDNFTVAVSSYYSEKQYELNADRLSDASKRLDRLRRTAKAFLTELNKLPTTGANHAADSVIDAILSAQHESQSQTPLRGIAASVERLMGACDLAGVEVSNQAKGATYKPGQAWNGFVKNLASVFEAAGKMVSAPKDFDGGKFKPSAFVSFVFDVQRLLPVHFHEHQHGAQPDSTLQTAVAKAIVGRV